MAKHVTVYCRSRASLGALIVRVFDGMGQWSHCAGVLADGKHVVEARAFAGVVVTPLNEVIERSSAWHLVAREVPDKWAGDDWALKTVGCGYDWFGAIGVPWHRNWGEAGRWFCSEHEMQWQIESGLRRIREGTRGISPNESYMVL